MSSKGKAVATGKGKGKWTGDDDKTDGGRKRRNREVLQFFEDAAEEEDYDSSEASDLNFDFDDFMDEDNIELKVKNEPPRAQNVSFMPKEEEMDEEEFDRMMEERYNSNPSLRAYRDDVYDDETNSMPSAKTPTIWKVKCTVGRERHSVFCLMQKFVELKSLGNKLQIISAFVVDHAKGFIYIEAEKQIDINEACKGLSTIYSSRLAQVPKNEVSHLLAIRNNKNPISEGMWARVKNGRYKGDLAQIVFVNEERRKATVKLIPRIDLQVLAQKIGGGVAPKNAVIPAPKLITSTELDEFRPLMTYRRDRDTNKMFEVLDGLMLKDGFLFKKVSIDSLSCHGIVPLEEELLKFRPSESNESNNLEWLTELYGGPKKKRVVGNDKGGEKGEGSSGSGMLNGFELYELVCYGRKDFGLVVGMEKEGDYYKILKQGPEGPIVVTTEKHLLKHGPSDVKFIALDHKSKRISVNDTVRVFEGPLKDREGIAKQIYKGIIFIYDHNETENGGYFCSKVQMCEKVELSAFAFSEKGGELGPTGFEDFPSSPKSPLSPQKPWQTKEKNRDFSQGDKEGMFAIGQTLRIKVGPLKGYLCQVLGIRYSDITVKLGSQQKVLTVKSEHLSEVRGRSSVVPTSDDPGSSSFKPFDLLGTEGGSGGWGDGAATSKDGDGWNTGDLSSERTSWPGFATGSNPANPSSSLDNDTRKGINLCLLTNQALLLCEQQAVEKYFQVEEVGMAAPGYAESKKSILRERALSLIAKCSKGPWEFDPVIPYLAMHYFDRFITMNNVPAFERCQKDINLIAICCLTLAWNMRSGGSFDFDEFKQNNTSQGLRLDYTRVLKMEMRIMKVLQGQLCTVTALYFVPYFFSKVPRCSFTRRTIHEIIIQAQGDIKFTKFKPSIIAAASFLVAASNSGIDQEYETVMGAFESEDKLNQNELQLCKVDLNKLMERLSN